MNRKKYDCNETVVDVVSEGMFTLSTQFLRKDDRKTISGLVSVVVWFKGLDTGKSFRNKFMQRIVYLVEKVQNLSSDQN